MLVLKNPPAMDWEYPAMDWEYPAMDWEYPRPAAGHPPDRAWQMLLATSEYAI
jgi:hypothetical protein